MTASHSNEGTWLEAIALFEQARAGEHLSAMRLLETSTDPAKVVHGLLRMLAVFLRGEEPQKLDRFLDASFNTGPPPLRFPFATHATPPTEEFGEKLRGNQN